MLVHCIYCTRLPRAHMTCGRDRSAERDSRCAMMISVPIEGDDGSPPPGGASPAIRAVLSRTVVAALPTLPPEQHTEILARASAEVLERARRSFPLAWLPMADHMHICDTIFDVVQRDAFLDLWGATFQTSMRSPMLRGIFGVITRMSDEPAATLLRNASRLYGHITRDIGTFEVHFDGHRSARAHIVGWPSALFDFEVWLAGTEASVRAALHGVGVLGATIKVEERAPKQGLGTYRVLW